MKSDDKERRIREAVITVVNRTGLSGLKIGAVAKEAGVAQGTVYIYFRNKVELINETYRTQKTIASAKLSPNLAKDLTYIAAFELLWRNYLDYRIRYRAEINFMEQCIESDFLDTTNRGLSSAFLQEVIAFFERGIREQQLKANDITLIIAVFTGFAKEIALNLPPQKLQDESVIDSAFEMCWNAIRR